jgi:AcrR family transcriptional regulator
MANVSWVAPTTTVSPRRARTRARLIAAATEVVARKGFHAASVDEIAARAGLSIGALYSNFDGKDDLLLAVFDGHLAWFEQQIGAALGSSDLEAAAARLIRLPEQTPEQFLVFIEFWAYAVRKPKVRRQFAKRMTQMRQQLASAIITLRGSGEAGLPADLAALLGLATGRGLALEALVDPDAIPETGVSELLAAMAR